MDAKISAAQQACAGDSTVVEPVQLTGSGFFAPGDTVNVQLKETVDAASHDQVDWWVAIQLPGGTLLYMTDNPFSAFDVLPAPFKRSNYTHKVLEFLVPPGMGGDYTFYAFFVKEGSNMTDLFLNLKPKVATVKVTMSNQ